MGRHIAKMRVVAVLFLWLSFPGLLVAQDSVNPACKDDTRVVGACFTVHGRLSNWNGAPTRRIWVIGTRRILGVRDDTDLPKILEDKLGDFDDIVTADFGVCPLTKKQAGHMRIVCVASVSNIKMSKRH